MKRQELKLQLADTIVKYSSTIILYTTEVGLKEPLDRFLTDTIKQIKDLQ